MLTETKVKLTTASGEDLGALGIVKVRGFLSGHRVDFEEVVATKAQKCMLGWVKLRENGDLLTLSRSGSTNEKHGKRMNLTRDGSSGGGSLVFRIECWACCVPAGQGAN